MRLSLNTFYRLIICLLAFMVIGADVHGQKKKKSKGKPTAHHKHPNVVAGDKYYTVFDYVKAAEEYKIAFTEDTTNKYALYKLAESYRMYSDYYNAEKYYKIAVRGALHQYPLSRYWYAIILKDNGNYLEAKEQFDTFRKEYKATNLEAELYKEKAMQEAKGCVRALEELKKPQRDYGFKSLPVPANSENADFSLVIVEHDSSIALTSSRMESKGKVEAGIGGSLTDVYRFKKGKGEEWSSVEHEHDGFGTVNTPFNESSGSFTEDKKKFYFTRCDEKVKTGDFVDYNCAIYVTYFENGKWGKPIRLNENINMEGQWNAQPSVSPNGQLLFFVSRRPGGLGMHDIWYSTCPGDDNWSKAINMGDKINTLFSDVSPRYYGKEKILFFSSNGREGFGGQDIFYSKEDEKDAEVKNIGMPFNSNRDDWYFVLGEKKGYITSNREGGIGNHDIYSFNIESKESLIAYINNDTTKEIKSISVVGTLTHEDTKEPAKDVGVILADDNSKKLKTSTTNDEGKFRFDNLSTDKNYKVLLEEENAKITKEIKYQVNNVEVKGSEKEVSKVLFENIYFDFNKADLRPEARKILDNLVVYCKKHPEIQIEMSANTDSFGSDEYNKVLSSNRGNNALQYLISKGIDKSALVVNAEGEGKPVAPNTTEVGRQLNRRVEFYILGGPGYTADASIASINPNNRALFYVARQFNMSVEELESYMKHEKTNVSYEPATSYSSHPTSGEIRIDYYVVQPKNTLFTIARLYGMNVDDLMSFNNLKPGQALIIGQKLKVKYKEQIPSENFYLVKAGDTLYSISKKNNLTVEELVKLNGLEGYILRKNMIIKVAK